MKFISQCTNLEKNIDSILTDGQTTFLYKDFPDAFKKIEQWFLKKSILENECLAVECENSIPSALFLLFLLENEYNFFVFPKGYEKRIPAFCRYIITIESTTDFILIPNDKWHDSAQISIEKGKLYLKTSGSTGEPKIAVIPHSGLQVNARITSERLLLTSSDRIALPVPIYHSYGLTTAFLSAIAAGSSIDLQKGANLLRYLKREREFNPNVAFMTPIFCETLAKGRRDERQYRLTVAAGDRFRGDVFSRYESLSGCLVNLYGSTEMNAIAAGNPNDPSNIRCQYVGKPMQGIQIRIEETKNNSPQELWCYNPFGFEGYVDNNGRRISLGDDYKEGWFRIKDLGQISSDGYIQVLGRSDHSVNRDGLLVFFADIEKAMGTISGIESVVIVSKGETERGKGLTAFCVPAKDLNITAEIIRSSCFKILPKNSVPDKIILIDSLPMLPNGKIDRQKLNHSFLHNGESSSK
ncbi:MAG: acyl--CoA ligase [Desulfobacterales bacterium]|nr:acyl--CoA ligase [Desulfobacterales bacterium]